MTRDEFKLIHSELIMQVQCIECDLKLIYAGMHEGDFNNNFNMLENLNLGMVIKKLKSLDNSDGRPVLSTQDYEMIENIRKIRNYWCHQCFLDYVYIQDDVAREDKFQQIAFRLSQDENHTWDLHRHLQDLRYKILKKYKRI